MKRVRFGKICEGFLFWERFERCREILEVLGVG